MDDGDRVLRSASRTEPTRVVEATGNRRGYGYRRVARRYLSNAKLIGDRP